MADADRDALLDLLGAVDALGSAAPPARANLTDAAARARRHLDRTAGNLWCATCRDGGDHYTRDHPTAPPEPDDDVDHLAAFQAFAATVTTELDAERDEHIRGHLAAAVRADRRAAGPEVRTHVQRARNLGATWEQVADTFGIGTGLARERFTPGVAET